MSRTPLIAANWKMNPAPKGAFEAESAYQTHAGCDVWVFPTYLDIRAAIEATLICGGQYGSIEQYGAHTGDICMQMLADAGCRSVLCGHSERREDHTETNEEVAAQAIAALEHGLHPIVCVGETLEERNSGKAEATIENQLHAVPLGSDITIAYEPVWAIGSNNPATPEDAEAMHAFIRSLLPDETKDSMRILYGGSLKSSNAKELLRQPNIDGGLVGGASLKPDDFREIVEIALRMNGDES